MKTVVTVIIPKKENRKITTKLKSLLTTGTHVHYGFQLQKNNLIEESYTYESIIENILSKFNLTVKNHELFQSTIQNKIDVTGFNFTTQENVTGVIFISQGDF